MKYYIKKRVMDEACSMLAHRDTVRGLADGVGIVHKSTVYRDLTHYLMQLDVVAYVRIQKIFWLNKRYAK